MTRWPTGKIKFACEKSRSKYGSEKITVGGVEYESKREARRCQDLKLLEKAGEIKNLRFQVRTPLIVNGIKVCDYVADAVYHDKMGKLVVEDPKGYRTKEYSLKKKLFEAIFTKEGLKITEV